MRIGANDHSSVETTKAREKGYAQRYGHGETSPRSQRSDNRSLDRLEGSVHNQTTHNTWADNTMEVHIIHSNTREIDRQRRHGTGMDIDTSCMDYG
jgi:hypothetical protein